MPQANASNSTTRRSFLSRLGVTSAALTVGIAPVVLAAPVDPVFAAIERHRESSKAIDAAGARLDECFALIPDDLKHSPRVGINVDRPSLQKCNGHYVSTLDALDREAESLYAIYPDRRGAARVRKWHAAKRAEWDEQVRLAQHSEQTSGYAAASKAYDAAAVECEVAYVALVNVKVGSLNGLTAWLSYVCQVMESRGYQDPSVITKAVGHLTALSA